MWIVFVIVGASAVGLILLLMPRFTPRTPHWANRFVPPRYRHRSAGQESSPSLSTGEQPA
ncbi:undecaprenyl-phosphate alpha-N-acetylglucosaminyl 1-phosphate transferase [Streptomyces badius]